MRSNSDLIVPRVADICRDLLRNLERLLHRHCLDSVTRNDFESARSLLESVPMGTNEFALARGRLTNAERYLRSSERGAARYELCLLIASLKNDASQKCEVTHRERYALRKLA